MVELIWDGKYDANGNKVAPLRVALPFQTVETVNESAQERDRNLFSYAAQQSEWRNRLIWGDKKYVLPSLLPEFAGKVDLIYIDPPFATGADFSYLAEVGDDRFEKEPNIIEEKAYRDIWGKGLNSYFQWFYETATHLYELLTLSGTLYVHLDWRMVHYAKVILDEIFGEDKLQNELIWRRSLPHGNADYKFGASHDTILRYTKSNEFCWNPQYSPHREDYLEQFYKYFDEGTNRRYRLISCINPNPNRPNLTYEWNGVTRVWKFSRDRMQRMHDEGLLVYSKNGIPSYKGYLDQMKGVPMQDIWTDISPLMGSSTEKENYPTQKPEALVQRLLEASSNENNLVLDCFCGSGTTAAVAEKLNRRWITCDIGRYAIHTTRKRLLGIDGVRPFVVQNLGKYERQTWQKAEFGENAEAVVRSYRRFILDLYHAEPVEGYVYLHGKHGGRMVHVGTVDSPIVPDDVRNIALEFRKAVGTGKDAPKQAGVDILGWDFALDMNETTRDVAKESGLNVRFIRIPREVLEKKAVEQGDIRFFELAALDFDYTVQKRELCITLTDFMVPPDDVPKEVIDAVSHWSEWIDYWAVDFNFRDDTFHNEWQSYRTRQDRSLQLSVCHPYEKAGEYTVMVKVIDILGNDTTKAVSVVVR